MTSELGFMPAKNSKRGREVQREKETCSHIVSPITSNNVFWVKENTFIYLPIIFRWIFPQFSSGLCSDLVTFCTVSFLCINWFSRKWDMGNIGKPSYLPQFPCFGRASSFKVYRKKPGLFPHEASGAPIRMLLLGQWLPVLFGHGMPCCAMGIWR